MEGEAAFARFVEEQHAQLVRSLTLYTGDSQLAADLAADALATAAARWPTVAAMGSPGGWVHRVAINRANSWFRRRAARQRALARHGPAPEAHHDPDSADVIAVREAVGRLPRRRRACVVLHHLAGLDTDEVAGALGITRSTVRSHLRHAYAELREHLDVAVSLDPPVSGQRPRPATHLDATTERPIR